MPRRKRQAPTVVWSTEDDNLLLLAVHEFLQDHEQEEGGGEYPGFDGIDWHQVASRLPGKPYEECKPRLQDISLEGKYFATIDELCPNTITPWARIDPNLWNSCCSRVCRNSAPGFERRHLPGDTRDPQEFVNTVKGALLDATVTIESITTVNDTLVPVDIFEKNIDAAKKAHLLPKAREDATTWNYPACAVLGLDVSLVDTDAVKKAVLGCSLPPSAQQRQKVQFPGIRNLLCNIVRMSNQGPMFDKNPYVLIFPIYTLDQAKKWAGEAYDAIVLCQSAIVAERIGMATVPISKAERATLLEVNCALELANEICQFLAHSVMQKTVEDVLSYQNSADKAAFARFRSERRLPLPPVLSTLPVKPVFKIFFDDHATGSPEIGHPAPDPLLLAFKSCNNWCRKKAGFRTLAGSEPEDDDDLSEEGRQNLANFTTWQNYQQRQRQHDEIMDMFGGSDGGISVS
mmetsp:Transcript_7137/g.17461  ORF Transcript_7137/g.17461 Transcript_7137/m.17461 type:complete len:460 (-) Transcript_7137:308-1687(-)